MKRIVLLMMLLTAVITACESAPDPDQDVYGYSFDLTCKDTGLNKANPYQPGDGINQIIVMSDSTIGDQYDEYTQQFSGDMPEEWFPQIVDGTFVYDQVELVACIHRTAVEPLDIPCEFEDGYSIKLHNATYEMTLRDPQTAAILDRQTITNAANCPNMFSLFTAGEKNPDQFPVVEEAQIQAFIENYVTQ
jgi:hypothetical protein